VKCSVPMSRNRAKAKPRRKSDPTPPFESLLEQLGREAIAARSPASPARGAPARGWAYPTAEIPPWPSLGPSVASYVEAEAIAAAPSPCVEEAVVRELDLSDALAPTELERIRRAFAYRNHPDRVGPAYKARALQRMTIANVLIDRALARARAK
jgi:hypothetical protein